MQYAHTNSKEKKCLPERSKGTTERHILKQSKLFKIDIYQVYEQCFFVSYSYEITDRKVCIYSKRH